VSLKRNQNCSRAFLVWFGFAQPTALILVFLSQFLSENRVTLFGSRSSGKVEGRSFGVSRDGDLRFNLLKLAPLLEDIHKRLSGVVIENLDWLPFSDKYNREGNTFLSRPAYWGVENHYPQGFV